MNTNEECKSSGGSVQASTDGSSLPTSEAAFAVNRTMAEAADSDDSQEGEKCSAADTGLPNRSVEKDEVNDDFIPLPEKALNFPQQLMCLIERETVDDNAVNIDKEKAIEWLSTGDKFIIRDKSTLETGVLPKYFGNKCKFMSFVRKLYRWGFRQVENESPDMMIFTHKNFIRGDMKRCLQMRSIVRKYSGPPITYGNASSSSHQRYGEIVGGFPNAGNAMANEFLQSNSQEMMFGVDNSMSSVTGYGGAKYSGPPIMDITSSSNSHQRYGEIVGRFPNAGNAMANEFLQSNSQEMMFGVDNSMSSVTGYGGAKYSGPPIIDITSSSNSHQRYGEIVGGFPNAGNAMADEFIQSNSQEMMFGVDNSMSSVTGCGGANYSGPPIIDITSSSNSHQRYGEIVGESPNEGNAMANEFLQSNSQAMMFGVDNSMSSVTGYGYGGAAYNMLRASNSGLPMNYGLNTPMQMAHSGFDRMQHMQSNMMGLPYNSSWAAQGSPVPTVAAAPQANQDYHSSLSSSSSVELNLASIIMMQNPTLNECQALEMAKKQLSETATSTSTNTSGKSSLS